MDLFRYETERRRRASAADSALVGGNRRSLPQERRAIRRYLAWISVGILVGLGLGFASLAISFSTYPGLSQGPGDRSEAFDPFERQIVRGLPVPWLGERPQGEHCVLRWNGLTASLIFWTGLGGVFAGVSCRRWMPLQRLARARGIEIPYAESSVVARGALSLGSMLLVWALVIVPEFLDPPVFFRSHLGISLACTLVVWALCILPVIAFVDERSRIFSIGVFPIISAGLTLAFSVVTVLPLLMMPPPPLVGLIAGAAYAMTLPWLKTWTTYTTEAKHVPWR